MIKITRHDDVTNERIKLYFDLIVGSILSTSALIGIIYWTIIFGISDYVWWLTGLIFWICYSFLSFSLIGVGIYSRYQEKHYDEREPRKDLRAPIVS